MAHFMVTPEELLGKLLEGRELYVLGEAVLAMLRELMEVEISAKTGASFGERTPERRLDTRVGTLEIPIPKLREGGYFPNFLEPRRRSEEAVFAVIAEAYVKGVSTRKVGDLVRTLGIDGISKSEVSRTRACLDTTVEAFRLGPLRAAIPTGGWTPPRRRGETPLAEWSPWPLVVAYGWRRPADANG